MRKVLGLEAGPLLESHRVRGMEEDTQGLCFPLHSLSFLISLFLHSPMVHSLSWLCTPKVNPNTAIALPIHASSLSVPPDNYSNLWFLILKPWAMTDTASHFLNPGHKSQSPEWALNQLLWNQKSTLDLLSCDQGWAAMVQMWGMATVGEWRDDDHFPSITLCSVSSLSWEYTSQCLPQPFLFLAMHSSSRGRSNFSRKPPQLL